MREVLARGLLFFCDSLSNEVHFWMKVNPKLLEDGVTDCLAKAKNVFTFGTSQIDKYQSLTIMNGSRTKRTAFPTSLLDKPCSRDFDMRLVDWIGRKCWVLRVDTLKLFCRHDGIHEETACIA